MDESTRKRRDEELEALKTVFFAKRKELFERWVVDRSFGYKLYARELQTELLKNMEAVFKKYEAKEKERNT